MLEAGCGWKDSGWTAGEAGLTFPPGYCGWKDSGWTAVGAGLTFPPGYSHPCRTRASGNPRDLAVLPGPAWLRAISNWAGALAAADAGADPGVGDGQLGGSVGSR